MTKPTCKHCSSTRKVKTYWSNRNLLKKRLKTHYCLKCAAMIVPDQVSINPMRPAPFTPRAIDRAK